MATKATTKAAAKKAAPAKTAKADKAEPAVKANATADKADPTSLRQPIVNEDALKAAQSALDKEQAQKEADEAGDTETIPLDLVTVNITRDNTTTQVKVLEHEVPILEKIHGEENIREIGATTVDVADFDPTVEFDTLIRKYGKNGERAVLEVYSGPSAIAEACGVRLRTVERDADGKRKRTRNKSGEQSMIVDFNDPDATPADSMKVRRIIHRRATKSTKR